MSLSISTSRLNNQRTNNMSQRDTVDNLPQSIPDDMTVTVSGDQPQNRVMTDTLPGRWDHSHSGGRHYHRDVGGAQSVGQRPCE
jgi:hypothetical protein